MLHLGRAVEQVDNAMEYANTKRHRPPKNDDQLLDVSVRLRQLGENAVEKGEVGLVIALAKPFQRLLKYHLLFRNLLVHADLATSKYGGVLKMVTEIETIVGGIEYGWEQKKEYCKVWDVLGRINGLDKVKKLAVPKPSRFLIEERRVLLGSSDSGFNGVEGGRGCGRLGVFLQSEDLIGGDRDLWLVVLNDVVLRCQRTGTVSLTRWGASWTESKSENLYKFLKARFITRFTLRYLTDEPSRLRRGMLTRLFEGMEGLHLHNR